MSAKMPRYGSRIITAATGPDPEALEMQQPSGHPGLMQMVNMLVPGSGTPGPDRQELQQDEVVYAGENCGPGRDRKNMRVSRTSLKFRMFLN